jgi:hypothetical protein
MSRNPEITRALMDLACSTRRLAAYFVWHSSDPRTNRVGELNALALDLAAIRDRVFLASQHCRELEEAQETRQDQQKGGAA